MSKITPLKDTDKFIVSQSNQLIEANYPSTMTARAHKIARLVISLISPEDKDLRTYTVKIDTIKKFLGMNSSKKWGAFYSELRDIQDKLNEKPIEFKDPVNGDYIRVPFLGVKVSKNGTVTFEISGILKPYLIELKKNFTSYQLAYIPKLKSGYSIRLYELLYQYKKIGKRYFELDDLQRKVGSEYKLYGDFKRKVLRQAQKDLKKNTDLQFVFSERKLSRKVIGLDFVIFENTPEKDNPNQLSFLEDALEIPKDKEKPALSESIVKTLNALGISEQNIAKYFAKGFDVITNEGQREAAIKRCRTIENYYLEKLELTKNAKSTDNAAGFFIKALTDDWTTAKTLQTIKSKEVSKDRNKAKKKLQNLELKISNLKKQKTDIEIPVYNELIKDDAILEPAYNAALEKLGDFVKANMREVLQLPIIEQYKKSVFICSGIRVELFEKFPERFKAVFEKNVEIEALEKDIKAIKQRWRFN